MTVHPRQYVIGIDVGTSGCRAIAIDAEHRILAEAAVPLPPSTRTSQGASEQNPEDWWRAVSETLSALAPDLAAYRAAAIALDGTSATVLACTPDGTPASPGLMYDDTQAVAYLPQLRSAAPANSAVLSASSSLAKLLLLNERGLLGDGNLLLHQSDWLSGRLCGRFGISDENNCLKLGYDPIARAWPDWLTKLPVPAGALPRVLPPGTAIGPISPEILRQTGISENALVVAGTTDSTASFLAAGATRVGEGVTALGSTLVLKILSDRPVFDAASGVYSHRLGDRWLVGGASNSGGAVLKQFFTDDRIRSLSAHIDPDTPSGLDYYPLTQPGERFPLNDPALPPKMTPRPTSDSLFLQGLLEGIAEIERQGYQRLMSLGAPTLIRVLSTGGGASNEVWQRIRQRIAGIPVKRAEYEQAAYGAALLALRGLKTS